MHCFRMLERQMKCYVWGDWQSIVHQNHFGDYFLTNQNQNPSQKVNYECSFTNEWFYKSYFTQGPLFNLKVSDIDSHIFGKCKVPPHDTKPHGSSLKKCIDTTTMPRHVRYRGQSCQICTSKCHECWSK